MEHSPTTNHLPPTGEYLASIQKKKKHAPTTKFFKFVTDVGLIDDANKRIIELLQSGTNKAEEILKMQRRLITAFLTKMNPRNITHKLNWFSGRKTRAT